jgi:hypothetical protein
MKITTESLPVRTLKWGGIAMAMALAGAFATLPSPVNAESERGHHRRPPPEAFAACKDKKADDACEVTLPDRKLAGKCAAREGAPLACRPDHPMGPPPQLFEACAGKSAGDLCSVTFGEKTREGKCAMGRSERLLCRP